MVIFSDSSMLWRQLESLNLMNQELLCWQLVELVGMIYVWSWQNWHILLSLCLIVEYWMFFVALTLADTHDKWGASKTNCWEKNHTQHCHHWLRSANDIHDLLRVFKICKNFVFDARENKFFWDIWIIWKNDTKKIHWFSKITKCKILFLSMFKVD